MLQSLVEEGGRVSEVNSDGDEVHADADCGGTMWSQLTANDMIQNCSNNQDNSKY